MAASVFVAQSLRKPRATAPGPRGTLWPIGIFVIIVVLRAANVLGWLGP